MLIQGLCLAFLPVLTTALSWCFTCQNAFHPAICGEVIACSEHESCYAEEHSAHTGATVYSSGCKATSDCIGTNRTKRASVTQCTECCSGSLCNEDKCQAPKLNSENRLWCANCKFQLSPNDCGEVVLCSKDEMCSVQRQEVFGKTVYNVGCQSPSTCSGKTLEKDHLMCCNTILCNTNTEGLSPDVYTPPPPTTTPPPPSPAVASIENATIDYVIHHAANETLQIVCNIGGFPVPNVTWTFTPAAASGGNDSSNDTSLDTTAAPGNTTAASVELETNVILSNSTAAPVEITKGVTTSDGVSKLQIVSPTTANAGVYVCSVANNNGTANDSVAVTVSAVPLITGELNQTIQTDARNDVLLECDVSGIPPPNVTWVMPPTAGGVDHLANGSVLLHNVHADNDGNYLCLAENSAGKAVKTVKLSVTDNVTEPCPSVATAINPASPPANPIATPLTSGSQPPVSADIPVTFTSPSLPASLITVGGVWSTFTGQPFVLQCQVPGSLTPMPITWSRLEQDFDHGDSIVRDNGYGTLVIVERSAPSLTITGVYECRVPGGSPDNVQRFVIYKEFPSNVSCTDQFSKANTSAGTVLRATCGPCPLKLDTVTSLAQDSLICEVAEKKGVLPPTGGAVTWLIRKNGGIALLADDHGAVKIVT